MELIASLFCHVSESIPEAEIQRELQRQHDICLLYTSDAADD